MKRTPHSRRRVTHLIETSSHTTCGLLVTYGFTNVVEHTTCRSCKRILAGRVATALMEKSP